MCHDMNPPSELHASNPRDPDAYDWNGDCYKAWVKLKSTRNDLDMAVVESDWGTGVIRVGKQNLIDCDYNNLEYLEFEENRKEYLNLITEAEFWDKYR